MIPEEIKPLKQWCCYKLIPDDSRPGKFKKIPINAVTGGQAQSNNPETWCNYETAFKNSNKYNGLGFFFANGYFGVDIDGVEEDIEAYKNGEEENIIYEFIHTLNSYSEYSVSGKGIHIICKGKLPASGRRKANVEMYSEGRFFIMTGNIAAEYIDIVDCTESIKALHSKYIATKPQVNKIIPINLSDNEIIKLASNSKQGSAFKLLWSGNWEGLYNSQSEADIAFCNMLAFWCQRDAQVMDSLFRQSGLYREKWDRKQAGSTYGAITISKAISDCRNTYEPKPQYSVFVDEPKKARKVYSLDDTGNAERFRDSFGHVVRYSYTNKGWMYYNGKKWTEDTTGEVKNMVDIVIEKMKLDFTECKSEDEEKAFTKHLKATRSNKGKTAMIRETEHLTSITPDKMDNHNYLLNVSNGIVNLKKGELTKHDPEKFITKYSHVEYSDKVDCPLWESFLVEIFNNDKELIRYIQKAVGYSLTGSTSEQCAFFCYGTGRNGKSTFLEIITEICGDYAINIQPETIMIKNNQGASSDIARLKGARFVTSVEPNEGVRLNEGLVKQLTGGDRVTARKLYGNEFEFAPEFKLWMGTNHKPIIRGTDTGIWRRIRLIPFTVYIPDEKMDKNLKLKLRQELTGILKWAVDGCLLWQREGLELPEAIKLATKEYRGEMDVISAWIDECCEESWACQDRANNLYQSYVKWASENNEYVMSSTKFGKEMKGRYGVSRNSVGQLLYLGISLKGEFKPYEIDAVL